MKVLLITDNHTPIGGAEHYFFDLKNRLKKVPGLEVYSLGFGPKAASGEDFLVLKGLRSKIAKLFWQIVFHPWVFIKIRKHLKTIQPDVIHIHNIKQYTHSLLRALAPYPVVQTIHDYGAVCPVAHNIHVDGEPCPTGLRRLCFWQHRVKYNHLVYLALAYTYFKTTKRLKNMIKQFFAPSPQLVAYLQKNGFNHATCIIPFKQDQAYSFTKINPNHFLFAGNLGTHKGVYLLIEEFALAVQKNQQLTLTIAGTGPEEASLHDKVNQLGLEKNIFFSGWNTDLSQYYASCAAVIFPSLWMEAFGLVITEAMSQARPVIGTNRGSVPWLVEDQHSGYIFDPLKKGDLAEKILNLAGNSELIKKLGTHAHLKLQTLVNNEEMLATIVSAYKACIAS